VCNRNRVPNSGHIEILIERVQCFWERKLAICSHTANSHFKKSILSFDRQIPATMTFIVHNKHCSIARLIPKTYLNGGWTLGPEKNYLNMLSLKCCKYLEFSRSTFRVEIEAKMKVPNIYYLVKPSNKYVAVNKRPPPSSELQTNPAAELYTNFLQYSLNTWLTLCVASGHTHDSRLVSETTLSCM
jgi:hypothetical protein